VTGIAKLRQFFFPEGSKLRWLPFTIVSTVGILVAIRIGFSDQVQRIDWQLYDRFTRVASRNAEPPGDIVVVAIDELSFSELGMQWPWPRRVHAALIDKLARAGARTIVFDLLFDVDSKDPEDDQILAAAIRGAGNVVLAMDRADATDRTYSVVQWTKPIPQLAEASAGLGAIRFDYDPDGVLRTAALSLDDQPSLALAAASRTGGFHQPTEPERSFLIHFNGPPRLGIRTVSYYQALDAEKALPPGLFKDKTVLVGLSLAAPSTPQATADHFTTPAAVEMAGVEIHANVLDTLLRNRAIADPFGGRRVLLALMLVVSAIAALTFYRLSPATGILSLPAIAAGWISGSYGFLASIGTRVPVIPPLIAIVGAYASAAAYRYALVSRERRFIKRAFEHYVSPAVVQRMLADPAKLQLGGEEWDVTVIFTDIEGFTGLAERLSPRGLQQHLSRYFTEMLELLLREGATLDKLIGDSIMAYFGCPIANAVHAEHACRGALAIQRRMVELNREWQQEGLPALQTRIGINSGIVVAGNMGTTEIFNYTVLGDTVNLASRLEGVNKEYGSFTIIGEDTWSRVQHLFEARELDFIRVKGKADPVAIYELAAEKNGLPPKRKQVFERFASGLALYRQREWERAERDFEAALAIDANDGPSATLLKRCERYRMQPPEKNWDGVYIMNTK